jgi:hypothetical protein
VNDQHPPYKPGDRVTLVDPRWGRYALPATIAQLQWDHHDGDWFATLDFGDGTPRITRRVGWLHKGWPT